VDENLPVADYRQSNLSQREIGGVRDASGSRAQPDLSILQLAHGVSVSMIPRSPLRLSDIEFVVDHVCGKSLDD
jgi:hypothetical protein